MMPFMSMYVAKYLVDAQLRREIRVKVSGNIRTVMCVCSVNSSEKKKKRPERILKGARFETAAERWRKISTYSN